MRSSRRRADEGVTLECHWRVVSNVSPSLRSLRVFETWGEMSDPQDGSQKKKMKTEAKECDELPGKRGNESWAGNWGLDMAVPSRGSGPGFLRFSPLEFHIFLLYFFNPWLTLTSHTSPYPDY